MSLFKKISTAISRIKPVLAIAAFSCIVPVSSQASTAVSVNASNSGFAVSFGYFQDSLAPYGRWIAYEPYGYCWTPYQAHHAGWRPYVDGYWAYTDYGWSWISAEPYGWATYHYGRWVPDPYYGWVWVPDTVWAPSWVAWHQGPGWVGWAPLPPAAHWNVSVGFSYVDYDYIPSSSWCFVEDRHFNDSGLSSHIVVSSRNDWMLQHTHNVTRYRNRNGWPVNDGLNVRDIERSAGKVKHLNIVDASAPFKSGDRIRGNAVEYYRPKIQEKNVRGLKPADRFMANRSADAFRKSTAVERGGPKQAFADERVALEKNRENGRYAKAVERNNSRQSVERVEKRQVAQRTNQRQEVERANKRQTAQRVQSEKRGEPRQFAEAGPHRRSVGDVIERRADVRKSERESGGSTDRRKAQRLERGPTASRDAQRVEERGQQQTRSKASRNEDRAERSQKASKGSRGGGKQKA
jgi:hypothetical protein